MHRLSRYFWPFKVSYTDLSAKRVFHEVRCICLAAVLWPITSGTLLLHSGLSLTEHQKILGLLLIIPTGVLLLLLIGNIRLSKDFAPIHRFLSTSKEDMTKQIGKDGLIAARNFQALAVHRILLYQGPAFALGFSIMSYLCNVFLSLELELWQVLVALMVSSMVAIGHAVFEYYALGNLMNHIFARAEARGVTLSDTDKEQVIRVDTRRKLIFVSCLIMTSPMLILGTTLLIRVRNDLFQAGLFDHIHTMIPNLISWMLIIVGISTFISLMISLRMANDTADSVSELSLAMQRVKEGNLNTSLLEKSNDEFADVFTHFNRMVEQLTERERLRDAFGRYVSKDLTDEVMKHGINLEGHTLQTTIMFTDLRGFSAISESLPPENVVDIINSYLDEMSQIIQHFNGTINELMGDGLLVIFGAPTPADDDATRAVACALSMQLAMSKINARNAAKGYPEIEMGIGIHSGKVVAGNVGSKARTKYAMVGSAVNLAARVESLSVGGQVLATMQTLSLIHDEVKLAGEFTTHFKGINWPVTMCDVIGIAGGYRLYLPEITLDYHRLAKPQPLHFKNILDKAAVGESHAAQILEISDKYAVLCTDEPLELHSNLKITLETTLLADDSRLYAKILRPRGEHCYEINFTFMSRDTRYFLSNLKLADS